MEHRRGDLRLAHGPADALVEQEPRHDKGDGGAGEHLIELALGGQRDRVDASVHEGVPRVLAHGDAHGAGAALLQALRNGGEDVLITEVAAAHVSEHGRHAARLKRRTLDAQRLGGVDDRALEPAARRMHALGIAAPRADRSEQRVVCRRGD